MNTRDKCIFCNSNNVITIFENDINIPQNLTMIETQNSDSLWMPYNIQKCNICKTYQNKYLADLDILYKNSHIAPVGNIRNTMDIRFADIILSNNNITGILEIGAGKGYLADILLEKKDYKYIIVDPSYTGNTLNRIIINEYIENIEIEKLPINTLVMSHIFEHFYEPKKILDKLLMNDKIEHICICHPNFDRYTDPESYTYNILHCEHTYYIENNYIVQLLHNYGFELITEENHKDYVVLFNFERKHSFDNKDCINSKTDVSIDKYFKTINNRIQYLNNIINTSTVPVYIWPCSVHSIILINHGLEYKKLAGILDNSSYKIGKYMYGFNIECFSMKDITSSNKKIKVILNGGCFNKDIEVNNDEFIEYII